MVVLNRALRDVAARQNDGRLCLRMQDVGLSLRRGRRRSAWGRSCPRSCRRVLAQRHCMEHQIFGRGSMPVNALLSKSEPTLSALASRAAGWSAATLCVGPKPRSPPRAATHRIERIADSIATNRPIVVRVPRCCICERESGRLQLSCPLPSGSGGWAVAVRASAN
jgi:hypothetical protein